MLRGIFCFFSSSVRSHSLWFFQSMFTLILISICKCLRIFSYIYIYIFVYIYLYKYMKYNYSSWWSRCWNLRRFVWFCRRYYIHTCIYTHLCIFLYIYICVFLCMNILLNSRDSHCLSYLLLFYLTLRICTLILGWNWFRKAPYFSDLLSVPAVNLFGCANNEITNSTTMHIHLY